MPRNPRRDPPARLSNWLRDPSAVLDAADRNATRFLPGAFDANDEGGSLPPEAEHRAAVNEHCCDRLMRGHSHDRRLAGQVVLLKHGVGSSAHTGTARRPSPGCPDQLVERCKDAAPPNDALLEGQARECAGPDLIRKQLAARPRTGCRVSRVAEP